MRRPSENELTEREVQVLRGVASGHTNATIGRDLHLTEETVKSHVARLRYKLGARDRSHAVALGYEHGVLRVGTVRRT
jgi:DNA-binding NarL/FixJ family response regulator